MLVYIGMDRIGSGEEVSGPWDCQTRKVNRQEQKTWAEAPHGSGHNEVCLTGDRQRRLSGAGPLRMKERFDVLPSTDRIVRIRQLIPRTTLHIGDCARDVVLDPAIGNCIPRTRRHRTAKQHAARKHSKLFISGTGGHRPSPAQ